MIDCYFLFLRNDLIKAVIVTACFFLLGCQPAQYWVLIIYDRNSTVAETLSVDGYRSKQACQLAAKQHYPDNRFLCVLEDDIGI